MTTDSCRPWREQTGALALGQLSDDEAAALRAHLDGCPDCRAEAERLAPMAELLSRVSLDRVLSRPAVPLDLGDRVLRRVTSESRAAKRHSRRRLGFAFAGAAASLATAAAVAILVLGGGASPGQREVAFRSLPPGVDLGARLEPRDFGSVIHLRVLGVKPGTRCTVFLKGADGSPVPAGSFRYLYDGDSDEAVLTAALAPGSARTMTVRAGGRTFTGSIE